MVTVIEVLWRAAGEPNDNAQTCQGSMPKNIHFSQAFHTHGPTTGSPPDVLPPRPSRLVTGDPSGKTAQLLKVIAPMPAGAVRSRMIPYRPLGLMLRLLDLRFLLL